jgi:hypothetical protein
VARTIVSPLVMTTAPSACLARWPVSNVISARPMVAETDVLAESVVLTCLPPLLFETEAEV